MLQVHLTEHITYRLPTRVIGFGYRLSTYHHNDVANEISYNICVMDLHLHAVPHDLGLSMDAIIDSQIGYSFT